MMQEDLNICLGTYVKRFQVHPPYFSPAPNPGLCLSIVVPAYKEPDIRTTLNSLAACDPPAGDVEIIIVINAPENSDKAVLQRNDKTAEQITQWVNEEQPDFISTYVIREEHLHPKHAGAGWARKIGMDEAAQRWARAGKDGPILCLDADCTVSQDYFTASEKIFSDPAVKIGHFNFEHLYETEPDPDLREGILHYELHLRCYIHGLALAGYPNAVHTVGSCMAVRASSYAKGGGMNRRKAGEDFYFLHKLVPLGGWKDIPATVYPSCRVSDRVPFGTGRAQSEWKQNSSSLLTYHPSIYTSLQPLFQAVPDWYNQEINIDGFSPEVIRFLTQVGLVPIVRSMKSQSNSPDVFRRRFWQWMDGFMVLRMTHFLRDHGWPNQPVQEVAQVLAKEENLPQKTLPELLEQFRQYQHAVPFPNP